MTMHPEPMHRSSPRPSRWQAILHQRCPSCRVGPVFSGLLAMRTSCPVCGLVFEREPGYFVGAMYISYMIALVFFSILMALLDLLFPDLAFLWTMAVATLLFLPFVPLVFRYARVTWMHLDRTIDP